MSHALLLGLCSMAVYLLLSLAAVLVFRVEYGWFLILYVPITVLSGIVHAFFRGMGQLKICTLFGFVSSALTIVLNVVFIALLRLGLVGMMCATLLGHAVSIAVFALRFGVFRGLSFSGLSRKELRGLLQYGLPLISNRISWNAVALASRAIIVGRLGSGANGLFAVSNKFSTLLNTIYSFFYQSWTESASRIWESGDRAAAQAFYRVVQRRVKCFMLSAVLLMIAAMPIAFKLMVDEAYAGGLVLIPPMLLAVYFDSMASFLGGIFAANMDSKTMGATTGIAAVLNPLLCWLLVGWLGLWGAALAVLLTNAMVFGLRSYFVRKYIRFGRDGLWLCAAILVSLGVSALFYWENALAMPLSLALALAFALVSNRDLLIMLIRKMQEKAKK